MVLLRLKLRNGVTYLTITVLDNDLVFLLEKECAMLFLSCL